MSFDVQKLIYFSFSNLFLAGLVLMVPTDRRRTSGNFVRDTRRVFHRCGSLYGLSASRNDRISSHNRCIRIARPLVWNAFFLPVFWAAEKVISQHFVVLALWSKVGFFAIASSELFWVRPPPKWCLLEYLFWFWVLVLDFGPAFSVPR